MGYSSSNNHTNFFADGGHQTLTILPVAGVGSGAGEMHSTGLAGLHQQMLPHLFIRHLAGAVAAREGALFKTLAPAAHSALSALLAPGHALMDDAHIVHSFDVVL